MLPERVAESTGIHSHRFLEVINLEVINLEVINNDQAEELCDITELDETFFRESFT